MGIETAAIIAGTLGAIGATGAAMGAEKPKSAASLQAEAQKNAQQRRRAILEEQERGGKTMFTSPIGAGEPRTLTKKLGAGVLGGTE